MEGIWWYLMAGGYFYEGGMSSQVGGFGGLRWFMTGGRVY